MTNRKRIRTEPGNKRVRVYLGGRVVADTTQPLLVWEKPYYPVYYFPVQDVAADLTESGPGRRSPSRGDAIVYHVTIGDNVAEGAAYRHLDSPIEEIRDHVAFDWASMDSWFEEDEEVFVHARNPYTRVDILPSSRRIEVVVDGVTVADSRASRMLFETGLPVRYYIPKTDVRMDLLEATDLHTSCPYKGTASYYDVVIDGNRHESIVWWYPQTTAESQRIAGLVAFYNERLDILVDGEKLERPHTMFS